MKDLTNNSDFSNFRSNKLNQNLVWAFIVPVILAFNCIGLREYLEVQAKAQCPPPGEGGFSFDLYGSAQFSFLDIGGTIQCASDNIQLFYKILGVSAFIFICLSTMLPVILYRRRRPVKPPELFG